jgi:uncharacterized protein (TIGR03086 family)
MAHFAHRATWAIHAIGRRGPADSADAAAPPRAHARAMPNETTADRLLKLGRDREAVEAATAESPNHRSPEGEPMDGVAQLDVIIPALRGLVDNIGPDALDRPTPCANFAVAGVLEHMIAGATAFAPAFRGQEADDTQKPEGGSVQERWQRAMDDLVDALHTPGAQERTIASPFGPVPGAAFARYVAFDGLVHGWDLAVATGQPYAPDDALVGEVDAFIRGLLQPAMRDGDTFAAETQPPADASPLERVVAFSGRDVRSVRPRR